MTELTPEIRAYLKEIGRNGGRNGSRAGKSIRAHLSAASRWRLRRLRYGDSGRRQKPYAAWLKSHNKTSACPVDALPPSAAPATETKPVLDLRERFRQLQ